MERGLYGYRLDWMLPKPVPFGFAMNNLANTLRDQGEYARARGLQDQVLEVLAFWLIGVVIGWTWRRVAVR